MSADEQFFVTNQFLNKKFPLATCPSGSLDNNPEADWYIRELSGRFLAALFINDTETMQDIQCRLAVHRACREVRL